MNRACLKNAIRGNSVYIDEVLKNLKALFVACLRIMIYGHSIDFQKKTILRQALDSRNHW
jgi:hypothetical protein